MHQTSHERYSRCVDAANACANVCEWTASSALQQAEAPSLGRCIALALDCAEVCRLSATLLLRSSALAEAACLFCVEAAEACANECRRHRGIHYDRCVDRCRKCIDECWAILRREDAAARQMEREAPVH
jgi:hypothetical protein